MPDDNTGGVVIGLREVYDAVIRLTATVDRLVDSDKGTRNDLTQLKTNLKDVLSDHENRIRSLEKGRWPIASLSIIISIGALGFTIVYSLLSLGVTP